MVSLYANEGGTNKQCWVASQNFLNTEENRKER